MYSFAQRADTKVYDEPLYGYYLQHTPAKAYHPGAEEILANMETDGQKVVEMMQTVSGKPVYFFKNMTHHLLDLDLAFMKDLVNIILTRDPVEMLPSFDKVIQSPSMGDVGYKMHTQLIEKLQQASIPFVVLDAKKVLLDPKGQLQKLCKAINIPFDEQMLRWKKGARPEDGSWAPYWYANIHNSTGYLAYKPKSAPFPEHLKPLLAECQPHYEQLLAMSL